MVTEELLKIKDKVVNRISIVTTVLIFVPYVFSLFRWIEIGWQNIYVLHSALYILFLSVALFRKKLSLNIKIIVLSLFFAIVGYAGLWNFGFSGSHFYLLMSVALISILSNNKLTFSIFGILLLIYMLIAFGFVTNSLNSPVDLNAFSHSVTHWITTIASLSAFSVIYIMGFRHFYLELIKSLNDKAEMASQIKDQFTALKKVQMEAEETKTIIDHVSNNLTEGMFYQVMVENETERRFTYVSDTVCDFYGHSAEEVMKDSSLIYNRVHPEDIPRLIKEENEALAKMTYFKTIVRIINPDGSIRWSSLKSTPRKIDDKILWDGIEFDITDLKKKELQLTQAKEKAELNEIRLKEAQQLAKMGNWELDVVNDRLYWSDEIYRIFGCEPQEFDATYEGFLNFVYPDDRETVNEAYTHHLQTKEPYDIQHRILLSSGELKYVHERCNSEYDTNGKALRSIGTVADITDNILFQNELTEAKERAEESDRLKSEFINNLSHEIRTPMNGIMGFSDLLSDDDITPERQKNYINVIQNSSMQLMHIIDDILEISMLGTNKVTVQMQEVSINNLLFELFSIFDIKAKQKKIHLYFEKSLSDDESIIYTDETKLHKVISNLLENAIKYTNSGFVEIGCERKNEQLRLFVKDSGIGIDIEKQKEIFGRFAQVDRVVSQAAGGLGLGLSIAKENVDLLGGHITVESERGHGAIFTVIIPYEPVINKNQNSDIISHKTLSFAVDHTILIVEDEEINFLYLDVLFETKINCNCKVIHAKNGKEAIEICRSNPSIDLVLMDVKMPEMNGYEATRKIKEFRNNLPVIAQTAYSTQNDMEEAIAAGCDDFVAKPIKEEYLIEKVMKLWNN